VKLILVLTLGVVAVAAVVSSIGFHRRTPPPNLRLSRAVDCYSSLLEDIDIRFKKAMEQSDFNLSERLILGRTGIHTIGDAMLLHAIDEKDPYGALRDDAKMDQLAKALNVVYDRWAATGTRLGLPRDLGKPLSAEDARIRCGQHRAEDIAAIVAQDSDMMQTLKVTLPPSGYSALTKAIQEYGLL
jgi:hypothetical protein